MSDNLLTKEQIDAGLAICDAATEGHWYSDCAPTGPCGAKCYLEQISAGFPCKAIANRPRHVCGSSKQTFADMQFIAHARTGYPLALRQLKAAMEDNARLRAALERGQCPVCYGSGEDAAGSCRRCDGTGLHPTAREALEETRDSDVNGSEPQKEIHG